MQNTIKKSVATLLAHIIKIDNRDIKKETPIFCRLMKVDFDCNHAEAEMFLHSVMKEDYDLDSHISIINQALANDQVCKMHILEQINQVIYSDTIQPHDYEEFEKIKNALFPTTTNPEPAYG